MLRILDTVYSWPFIWGAIAGTAFWKIYCHTKARYLDRHYPRPDGARHAVARMSRQWMAAAGALLSLGYVLMATERTQEHTAELNAAVQRCWGENRAF